LSADAMAVVVAGGGIRSVAVGRCLPRNELQIRRTDGTVVGDREVGTIWLRSDSLFSGYFRDPDSTATLVVDGWLNTGDLARQEADGALFIVGRTKELIIRSGFNVHPAEVEGVLNAQAAVTRSWRCSNASRPRAAPSCSSSRTRKAPWTLPTTCI